MTEACIVGWSHSPVRQAGGARRRGADRPRRPRRDRGRRHRAGRDRRHLRRPVQQRLLQAGFSVLAGAAEPAGAALHAVHALRERLRLRLGRGAWRAGVPGGRARPVRARGGRGEDDRDPRRAGRRHPALRQLPARGRRHPGRVRRRVRAHRRAVFPALRRPVRRAGGDRGEEPPQRRGQPLRADAQGSRLRVLPRREREEPLSSRRR